jgi:hypothetical protein
LTETTELRKKLVELEQSQVGVKEATGNNDGKEVEMYLRSVGLKKGNAYCAAGQAWSHIQLNIPNPESGYSPNWFRTNVVYWKNAPRVTEFKSRPGQVCGFWVDFKGRIGHVGMIKAEWKNYYETVEFNTNGSGSDEGQGVHNLLRKKYSVYAISDFVGYKEILKAMKK